MALRRFIPWPDRQLCQQAKPIGAITQNACALGVGMIEKNGRNVELWIGTIKIM